MIFTFLKKAILFQFLLLTLMQANAQWNKVYDVSLQMRGINFINKDTGYICGAYEGPKLMKTTTGAYTWEDITGSFTAQIFSVHFINKSIGFVYCDDTGNPGIYKTTDGGSTWMFNYFSPPYIWSFSFVSPTTGYAFPGVMEYAYCVKTTDGGDTWTQIASITTPGEGFGIWDSHFPNENRGYFVTDEGSVYRTLNAGINWTKVYHTSSYSLRGVYFTSPDSGYVTGAKNDCFGSDCGLLLTTIDGGTTWQSTYFPNECYDIIFTDSDTGYMSSSGIYNTTDKCVSWVIDTSNYYYSTVRLDFPTRNIGYAIGAYGSVLKHDPDIGVSTHNIKKSQGLMIFPIPATGPVNISFDIESASEVIIDLLSSQGIQQRQLYHGFMTIGHHTLQASMEGLPADIYYCRLITRETVTTKKIVVVR